MTQRASAQPNAPGASGVPNAPREAGPLRVFARGAANFDSGFESLRRRGEARDGEAAEAAQRIVADVRARGAAAVLDWTQRLDGARPAELEVGADEWRAACERVPPPRRRALETAAARVRHFHQQRLPGSWRMRDPLGADLGQRVRPLHRAGVYVPGGKASYPSTALMNALPAAVAGVPQICMATPPAADGSLRDEVLLAARIAGVHRVFRMGGAQAVAALAYGAGPVPAVDKIVGPGNAYVQAAKRLVFGAVDIDSEAGPTEVLVVADETARAAWVAADLLSQAEHEEGASALLLTHAESLPAQVNAALRPQLAACARAEIARAALAQSGAAFVTRDLAHSLSLADRYAPEHLVLAVANPEAALAQIANAGTVFLGHYTPVAVGDYLAGPNHVLPTGGTARFFSPLGAEDFLKRSAFVHFEAKALRALGDCVMQLAELEGFPAHGASVAQRLSAQEEN